jgi:hypothetical protein
VSAGPGKAPRIRELFAASVVDARIDALAGELAAALPSREPLLVDRRGRAALRGAAGARPEARGPPESLEVRARRSQGTTLGEVVLEACAPERFRARDVVITDDIADEGRTLEAVSALVRSGAPRSLRGAVLVSKPSRRRVALALEHVGFEVGEG